MSIFTRMILMAAVLPLAAGCDSVGTEASPGLPTIPPPMVELPPAQPEPALLPFPQGRLDGAQAEILLAGDPMALRFLALKQLTALGEVPVEDSAARKDANMGALLPLSTPQPPAAGLERPIPPLAQLTDHFTSLDRNRGSAGARNAERGFLLDNLLPKAPAARQAWSPPDIASARKLQDRLGRLEDSGLITPEERARETAAVDGLIAGGALPELLPPPPPPPEPAAAKKATAGNRGARMPNGVSGKLEIIPSPPGVAAPKLSANAKGPAGIHLLSMGTAAYGDKAWDALKKDNPELAELGHVVSRIDLGELGTTYRLIAGPVQPLQADTLCAVLKTRGQACAPTPFPAP